MGSKDFFIDFELPLSFRKTKLCNVSHTVKHGVMGIFGKILLLKSTIEELYVPVSYPLSILIASAFWRLISEKQLKNLVSGSVYRCCGNLYRF